MPGMSMVQALNSAMDVMLARNSDVLIFGEDVGFFGGVFRATEGLQKKHGLERCFDTPIAESGLIGIAGPAEEPGSGNGIGEVMTGRSPEPVSGAPGGEIGTGGSTDGRNPLSPPPGMFGR